VDEFERITNRNPFFPTSATKYFDSPDNQQNDGYRLDLGYDTLLSISSVSWVDSNGVENPIDSNYYDCLPLNFGDANPADIVRFRYRYWSGNPGRRTKIKITGNFGFSSTVPQRHLRRRTRLLRYPSIPRKGRFRLCPKRRKPDYRKRKPGRSTFELDPSAKSDFEEKWNRVTTPLLA
jgi:hypothetical protein